MSEQEIYLPSLLPENNTDFSKTNISKLFKALFSMDVELFHCEEQTVPDMTMKVSGGRFFLAGVYKEFSLTGDKEVTTTNTASVTAPTTNPRIDLHYWDTATETLGIITGTEGATPAQPTMPNPVDKIPFRLVYHRVGSTKILNSDDSTNSYIMGRNVRPIFNIDGPRTEPVHIIINGPTTDASTGDGKAYFTIPESMDGWDLVSVQYDFVTAGTTGTMDIQVHNLTKAQDMLSTKITVDSTEISSSTAAIPAVIDTGADDVSDGDRIRIDHDAVQTTKGKGGSITLEFRLP